MTAVGFSYTFYTIGPERIIKLYTFEIKLCDDTSSRYVNINFIINEKNVTKKVNDKQVFDVSVS